MKEVSRCDGKRLTSLSGYEVTSGESLNPTLSLKRDNSELQEADSETDFAVCSKNPCRFVCFLARRKNYVEGKELSHFPIGEFLF